jgi:hypothetical protein
MIKPDSCENIWFRDSPCSRNREISRKRSVVSAGLRFSDPGMVDGMRMLNRRGTRLGVRLGSGSGGSITKAPTTAACVTAKVNVG